MPCWLFDPLRIWLARLVALRATRETVRLRYDRAYAVVLAALDTVQDHEWQQSAAFYDEGFWTVEHIFTQQPGHCAEHAATIREILGRTTAAGADS
jgi:hypothetical protein